MSSSTLAECWLVANYISDAMPNSDTKGEAFITEELLKHIAISTDKTKSRQMFQLRKEWEGRCPS